MSSAIAARVLSAGGPDNDVAERAEEDLDWDEEEREEDEPGGLIDLDEVGGEGFKRDVGREFIADKFDGK